MEFQDFQTQALRRALHAANAFPEGSVRSYSRKSSKIEGQAGRSTSQQNCVNMETAAAWGLPLREEDQLTEPDGYSGEVWWRNGGRSGIVGDTEIDERFRPVLTRLVEEIVSGSLRAIVCFAEDRLWRQTGICDAFIGLLNKYNVLLFDRNGPIDIASPEGRAAVRNRAIAAQVQRDMASVNAKRGHESHRRKGKLTVGADVLGYRSAGRHTCEAVAVPDELLLVNRIFVLFADGEDEAGPLSTLQIAKRLMDEGVRWPDEVRLKQSRKRTEETLHIVYENQLKKVLTDCRYQGRQPHGKDEHGRQMEWDCQAFLIDGDPAVPRPLWDRVQAKLEAQKRTPNRSQSLHALAGLLRCGVCGQPLRCQVTMPNKGSIKYWLSYHKLPWTWCSHKAPGFRDDEMMLFVGQSLWPLMRAQAAAQRTEGEAATLATKASGCRAAIALGERRLLELRELALRDLSANAVFVAGLDAQVRAELDAERKRLVRLEAEISRAEAAIPQVEDFASISESAQRDAVRSLVRWIAVVPIDSPARTDRWGRGAPGDVRGKVVVCTSWGSLITGTMELAWTSRNSQRRTLQFRLAEPSETVLSVMDLPDPEAFRAGLQRSRRTGRLDVDPILALPGYLLPSSATDHKEAA